MGRRKTGRPPKIGRDDIIATAAGIADEEGLAAVTIRGVAYRLGVAPTTLYGHVGSAEELVDLVVGVSVARAVHKVLLDPGAVPSGGRETLIAFGRGLRDLLREHPAVLEAYRRGPIQDPTGLAVTEYILAALVSDGLDQEAAVEAYAAVYAYVVGFVQLEARPADLDVDVLEGHPLLLRVSHRLATMYDQPTFETGLDSLTTGVTSCSTD